MKAPPVPLYTELGENQIRLLTLQPSRLFAASIHTVLHTTNVFSAPAYKALSYVWGDSELTAPVFVNNLPFEATTNLVAALRHIRRKRHNVVIWVDAICINQNDTKERNHQVQMMREIYMKADQVIAWLGEAKDDSDLAM
ncbi:hypothetical protein K505DRAFT_230911, partial [Melanomma pulvis-pyrius CBS 109.77]